MRDVKLTNTSQILKEIDVEIKDFASKDNSSERLEYWSNVLNHLSLNYKEYISWSNIDAFDEVTQLEALFLLLDLPTRFLLENKDFEENLYNSNDPLDAKIRELFLDSAESKALINGVGIRAIDGWGNETNNIDVAEFINWSLHSAGFIKLSSNNLKVPLNKNESRSAKVESMQEIVDEYIHEYFKEYQFISRRKISEYIEKRIIEDQRLHKKTLGFQRIRKEYLSKSDIFLEYLKNL